MSQPKRSYYFRFNAIIQAGNVHDESASIFYQKNLFGSGNDRKWCHGIKPNLLPACKAHYLINNEQSLSDANDAAGFKTCKALGKL